MVDNLTKKQRSYCMSQIKSKNTKPEPKIKNRLENKGYIHQHDIYGKPDFINFKTKTVIFVDGCFWHKCPIHFKKPKSNRRYWLPKIEKNVMRDKEMDLAYKQAGWKTIRIWEHEIK